MSVITAPPPSTEERLGVGAVVTLVVVVLTLVLIGWSGQLAPPNHVDRLVVDNPHAWSASVDARPVGDGGWTGIGTVGPGATRAYDEVLDMGDTWNLRFRSPGGVEVVMAVTRSELKDHGWTVAVPASFATAANAARVPHSSAEPSGSVSAAKS